MAEFLVQMRRSSERRAEVLLQRVGERAMLRVAMSGARPAIPDFTAPGFDVIAEIKRRSPSAGALDGNRVGSPSVTERAAAYADAGAAAISVLTEPDAFGGCLDDLTDAALAVQVPVLRKDFLVHPIQIFEARAAGASGVLIILRLLDDALLAAMLESVQATGMFVLLEAFDGHDLGRAGRLLGHTPDVPALVGLNGRDLMTLRVDPARFEKLVAAFPKGVTRVAESGLADPEHVRHVVRLGYRLALVGEALMLADDPGGVLARLIAAGRGEAETCQFA